MNGDHLMLLPRNTFYFQGQRPHQKTIWALDVCRIHVPCSRPIHHPEARRYLMYLINKTDSFDIPNVYPTSTYTFHKLNL